jgi:hypothetical protein
MAQAAESHRRLPPEWNGVVPTEVFLNEAVNIVEKSKQSGVTLRAMGGVGIALRCPEGRDFARRLGRMTGGRQEYTDLDFAGLLKERNKLVEFFRTLNYEKRPTTISTSASQRQIYYHPDGYFTVDVLMDELLIANHPIDFRKRLGVDDLTLSLADLLLEKVQIWVSFSEKDLKDCLLLLLTHDLSDDGSDGGKINSDYIASLLAGDWGFYYTATSNLKKILGLVRDLDNSGKVANIDASLITTEERATIASRIQRLLKAIEDHPKSFGWKMRAKLGTSKQWYKTVETPATVGDFGIWRLRDIRK